MNHFHQFLNIFHQFKASHGAIWIKLIRGYRLYWAVLIVCIMFDASYFQIRKYRVRLEPAPGSKYQSVSFRRYNIPGRPPTVSSGHWTKKSGGPTPPWTANSEVPGSSCSDFLTDSVKVTLSLSRSTTATLLTSTDFNKHVH